MKMNTSSSICFLFALALLLAQTSVLFALGKDGIDLREKLGPYKTTPIGRAVLGYFGWHPALLLEDSAPKMTDIQLGRCHITSTIDAPDDFDNDRLDMNVSVPGQGDISFSIRPNKMEITYNRRMEPVLFQAKVSPEKRVIVVLNDDNTPYAISMVDASNRKIFLCGATTDVLYDRQ